MSKLEDKLNASIKPGRAQKADKGSAKTAPAAQHAAAKTTATKTAAAKTAAAKTAESDLNAVLPPLHPTRIWPD